MGRRPRHRARSAALAPVHPGNGRARRPQILGIWSMFKHNCTLLALATVSLCVGALPAQAAVKVLATTPDWGALVTELGGDKVNVYTATSAFQDVHRVDAKPSPVARATSRQRRSFISSRCRPRLTAPWATSIPSATRT